MDFDQEADSLDEAEGLSSARACEYEQRSGWSFDGAAL
jgi:hypothetical protein